MFVAPQNESASVAYQQTNYTTTILRYRSAIDENDIGLGLRDRFIPASFFGSQLMADLAVKSARDADDTAAQTSQEDSG